MSPNTHNHPPAWTVGEDRRTLNRAGQRTFLLADTLWAAFSRMTEKEWEDALRLRRRQGFNSVNVSFLPIPHDRSISGEVIQPFGADAAGKWDTGQFNNEYFVRAKRMILRAQAMGITPIVVLLWCNYAPGTWGAELTPEVVLSQEATDTYILKVLDTLRGTGVIYSISGDDDLASPAAIERYVRAAQQVRKADPLALITLHTTPAAVMGESLAENDVFDFYSYQAGHDVGWFARSSEMAARYAALDPMRPVYSMEPCYEGHGFGAGTGRHDDRNVRIASWTGLLGGASAGLGYAAHGGWSWHDPASDFNGEHFSGTPLPGNIALQLPGAWDVGFLRLLVEQEKLFDLRGAPELLAEDRSGAQLALGNHGDTLVAYLPAAFKLRVRRDLRDFDMQVWNLAKRCQDFVERTFADGITTINQPDTTDDLLYIFTSRHHLKDTL